MYVSASRVKRTATLFTLGIMTTGCVLVSPRFTQIKDGEFSGSVALQWEDTRRFAYRPIKSDPLRYVIPASYNFSQDRAHLSDGSLRVIAPGPMYTDVGSIPRPFWGASGLSPFDYTPAYVVHDWLYYQKECHEKGLGVYREYREFPYSRSTVDEILYNMMEIIDRRRFRGDKGKIREAARSRRLVRAAVSRFGGKAWETGKCPSPPRGTYLAIERRQTGRQKSALRQRGSAILAIITVPNP